ncbi:MAG TPA: amino acid permease [Alphaproteobacteria bacterium]|nr:amino acid permease [Alphaproteobacteria bacterium]
MTQNAPRHAGLSGRHVQFIAIGGAVGAGLFLGSGEGIVRAGPSLLLAYAASGVMVYFIARALGELTLNDTRAGSFTRYAEEYIGPWCGFVTGWSYWLSWVLVGMAEITAAGTFMQFWWPHLPQWQSALGALCVLYGTNRLGVRVFGELEFWLAIVKVTAIVALIVTGVVVITVGLTVAGQLPRLSNLWTHGGFFPTGSIGFLKVLPIAFFAFGGTELIGLTAREAEHPLKAVPRAINAVIGRILIFYIGSLTVVMALFPWDQIDARQSPFVLVFNKIGLTSAASLINFVVLTAVLSSCNSGLFATARVLTALAAQGHAPRRLNVLDRNGLPIRSLTASAMAMLVGVLLNYLIPETVFSYLLTAATLLLMWSWMTITFCHLRYRRARMTEMRPPIFPLPLYPYSNVMILGFIAVIVLIMPTIQSMQIPAIVAMAWFIALVIIHAIISRRNPAPQLR